MPRHTLPDGTTLNYDFFNLFQQPVTSSTHYTEIAVSGDATYTGVGTLGAGTHQEVEGGNFYNTVTNEGCMLLFNKFTTVHEINTAQFEADNGIAIQEIIEVRPDTSQPLAQAIESETTFTQNSTTSGFPATITLNPYTLHIIKYTGVHNLLVVEDFDSGVGNWTVQDSAFTGMGCSSPISDDLTDIRGARLQDTATTNTKLIRGVSLDPTETVSYTHLTLPTTVIV